MTSIFSELKKSTKQLHDSLEQVSYAREIMSKQLSSIQYADLIQKNYQIYFLIEPQLNQALHKIGDNFSHHFSSSRLEDLEKDLAIIGHQKQMEKDIHQNHFEDNSVAAWLGRLYVLEGSRLGGNVIVKALKTNPNLEQISAFHFYQQKNINIGQRWKALQKMSIELLVNIENLSAAKQSAKEMFQFFHKVHATHVY